MEILVLEDYNAMSKKAASLIEGQLLWKSNSVLGLATGSTPIGMYQELAKSYNAGNIDFSKVITFNLDEYIGLPKANEQSYYHFMQENLFKHINIRHKHINIPDGMVKDFELECSEYEEQIIDAGGIDLQVLGIGRNGHIGFNEPDVKFEALTHVVELEEDTIDANKRFFNSVDEVPRRAVSMGIKTIMRSKKIILMASGEGKAQVVKNMVSGSITPEIPASILQLHPEVVIIVDKAAGALL